MSTAKTPKRSFIGKCFKYSLIGWHVLIFAWLYQVATSVIPDSVAACQGSDACTAGAAIGTGAGILFICIIGGIGAGVLGMFTYFTKAKPIPN